MELRTLRYFLAIASERNITKAADILHVTQPTLSRQLSALEKELGTTLFVRSKHALTLTDDGILFRQRAEDIVDMVDRTENEFTGRTSTVGGTIALGVAESMGGRTFAKLIKMFSDTYPDVRFDLFNGMTDTIQDCIDSGTIDLGLLLEPIDTTRYEFMRLPQKELWGILVHRDHPLATQSSVSPQDVIGQSLMLPDRASSRREILNWIGCAEHRLKIILNYNILSNVALLVEEKLGIAFCLNGTARWLSSSVPICGLSLCCRNGRYGVRWCGKEIMYLTPQLPFLFKCFIDFKKVYNSSGQPDAGRFLAHMSAFIGKAKNA